MSRTTIHTRGLRRGTSLAALVSTTGLLVGGLALSSVPATSAEPAGDCAPTFPLGEVTAGQTVEGLTVDSGVTPEGFTGEVLGVLESGIAPGLDMIIMDLDSPAITAAGGIWQGMSGSPVYDATDGRLIGAVAYGLAYGSSPVAGITPFAEMDDYLGTSGRPAGRVEVGPAMARRIAQHAGVTPQQAGQGLRQLPMPLGVSGVSAQRLAAGAHGRSYLPKDTYAVGRSTGAGAAVPDDIVAGGNIAASLAYGDITLAGVGTATSVCDGRVVGFGHPMSFLGATTMGLHPADAIYVQEDPLGPPFKVANIAAPAGTITDDRQTGITGTFGPLPEALTVTSTITKGARSRTGSTDVLVQSASPDVAFYQQLANHDRVVDGIIAGSEAQSWTITGTGPSGAAFTASSSDRFTSAGDITFEASFDLADQVYLLSQVPGVELDSVTVDGVVTDSTAAYAMGPVQQYRNGSWITLGKGQPARVTAGRQLILRSVLASSEGKRTLPVSFMIPKRAAGQRGVVSLVGGNSLYPEFPETTPTLAKLLAGIADRVRNDEVQVDLGIFGRGPEIVRTKVSGPVDLVVNGQRQVRVVVQ